MVKQFDIIYIDLEPTIGNEKGKHRPCVIVSNHLINDKSTIKWLLPITSRQRIYPTDIPITHTKYNKTHGVIDTFQIKTLDIKQRHYIKHDHIIDENLQNEIIKAIQLYTQKDI